MHPDQWWCNIDFEIYMKSMYQINASRFGSKGYKYSISNNMWIVSIHEHGLMLACFIIVGESI
jgi:hypothetical protein